MVECRPIPSLGARAGGLKSEAICGCIMRTKLINKRQTKTKWERKERRKGKLKLNIGCFRGSLRSRQQSSDNLQLYCLISFFSVSVVV